MGEMRATAGELESLYWDERLSLSEIARRFNVSPATIHRYMTKYGIPRRPACGKEPVNLSPSPSLAYLIGVVYGDGNLNATRHEYNIRLLTKDRSFAESFASCVYEIRDSQKPKVTPYKSSYFCVKVASKKLYRFLSDKEACSLVIERFPADFIRGFADSEGSVVFGWKTDKRCKQPYRYGTIEISNSSLELISLVRSLLFRCFGIRSYIHLYTKKGAVKNIKGKKFSAKRNSYLLCIYKKADINKFHRYIGFSIKRKAEKLEEMCKLWAQR